MFFARFLSKILEKLYKYDSVRTVKEYLRPIKHYLFGKSDIYWVIETIQRARKTRDSVRVIFDVGAAVGDKTITFAKAFPKATIYCFEPQEEQLKRFKKRLSIYGDRIKVFAFGLFNINTDKEFHIVSYRDSSSILPSRYKKEEIEIRKIKVQRLDDFVKEYNIKHIDLIKIDVEGVEKEVLEGALDTLKDKIDNVFVEISPLRKPPGSSDYLEVFKMFHNCGFAFIGVSVDFFFSKDKDIINYYWGT